MTIIQLAGLVGWSRSAASRRLRADNPMPMTLAELEAVALVLDVPMSTILGDMKAAAA